jgi:signal transduction histidine kinase
MGEMIGNIAHQWRQPLSAISSTSSSMQLQMQLGVATDEDIERSYVDIMEYVQFLTQTIEDFRGFFKEDKEEIDFILNDVLDKSISITGAAYKDNNIMLNKNFSSEKLKCFGFPNELSQVFLNVLNNAKDALLEQKLKNKKVYLKTITEGENNVVYIQDNAGGIPKAAIDKVFDPYFTTKHQTQGTGIGLYMSKEIVEKHMKGSISVKNQDIEVDGERYIGACFRIALPKV